jgi:hypothetical protein
MKTLLTLLFVLLLAACAPAPAEPTSIFGVHEPEVRAVVEDFGSRLQNVSLLAPDAADQIAAQYGDLVTPELLAAWQADPSQAPGRLTSSPWPDHLDIRIVRPVSETEYTVEAVLVEMTSTGESGRANVRLIVIGEGDAWLISAFEPIDFLP